MKPVLVAITVDLENPQEPLFERRLSGDLVWNPGLGLEKTLEPLKRHGLPATFFANIFERVVWGRAPIDRALALIRDQGHEAGLLTRPVWVDEKRRANLFQYSAREQAGLLAYGAGFMARASGRRPVSHRAGGYGLGRDTLALLARAGFRVDSSNFFSHPNCRAPICQNEIKPVGRILEVPVTYFFQKGAAGPVMTDPTRMPEDAWQGYLEFIKNHPSLSFINLYLQASSLAEPQVETALAQVFARLAQDRDVRLATLSDLADEFAPSAEPAAPPQTAARPGEKVLVLVGPGYRPEDLGDYGRRLEQGGAQWAAASVYGDVMADLRGQTANFLDPKDLGRHYYLEKVGWTYMLPEQPRYRELFESAFTGFLARPEIGSWNGHDLYHAGDYNQSHTLGSRVFALIDLLADLIEHYRPNRVAALGLGGENQALVENILSDLGLPAEKIESARAA